MSARKLKVVIAQSPGKNPTKRHLEEEIATQLMLRNVAEVSLVPHLYDLTPDHSGLLWLKSLGGDIVVLAWLYPRAIHWILDRNGVKGREGKTLLPTADEDDGPEPPDEPPRETNGSSTSANRFIFALDLRAQTDPAVYVAEIERIARESSLPLVQLGGLAMLGATATPPAPSPPAPIAEEPVRRRWYPVIDYSRCTNCLECLDFCLFGVYGIDIENRILVENQDECKKGCPACSRVCPANAIIFPEHKTPAIAGAPTGAVEDFKIDLSKLFGAPSALELAVQERDTELVADGRAAVGMTVGLPKRQSQTADRPRDALDDLIDGLDNF